MVPGTCFLLQAREGYQDNSQHRSLKLFQLKEAIEGEPQQRRLRFNNERRADTAQLLKNKEPRRSAAQKKWPLTCISIGVKGVRGVPGKLRPTDDGVLGIDPEKLRGGLKSDIGVGGVGLNGDSMPPPPSDLGGESREYLCWGEPCTSSSAFVEL